MIAKMKFIKIASPVSNLDLVLDKYISKYEIQIENAVAELDKIKNLVSRNEINPYREKLSEICELTEKVVGSYEEETELLKKEEAIKIFDECKGELESITARRNEVAAVLTEKKEYYENILPYKSIDYDLKSLQELKFVSFRFGRIRKDYYKKLKDFMDDEDCTVFIECDSNAEYVWGIYFAPLSEIDNSDAIYQAMNFERLDVRYDYEGTFREVAAELEKEVRYYEDELAAIDKEYTDYCMSKAEVFYKIKRTIESASANFDLRKQIAFYKSGEKEYFILCGWMTREDADSLEKEIKQDDDRKITFIVEEEHEGIFGGAPIKLKNPKFLKPFEMLIKMYGLPDYKEFDPTWFVAISYTVIFGMMFGDVGQGICLAIGGFLLYKIKKMDLAAIIGVAGIFSTIFGFLFGSIFGYEDIIEPLWLRPAEHMADLPFVGKMNTIFAYAIALGMILILLMMVFNIVNAIRAKEWREVLFDHNGVCGLVFYGAVVACVMLFMTGHALPGTIVLVIMFVVPLILIILKEPLMAIVFKHKDAMPKEWGVFAVQVFFEMFEVLLSYFSNTLSFVRIGGFAVSHASMMAVVLMLAGAEHGGSMGNIFVIIIGNILVCGLEGLIVGIQVMRLEYYEMFSRFYRGGGREFKPYNKAVK